MKIAKLFTVFVFILATGCTNQSSIPRSRNPDWVNKRINQLKSAPVGNPPQAIWQYEYYGKTVYYIPAQCCDQFSQLYDESGILLCAPDGGFTGMGDGKCPEFIQVRKNGILIWQDLRGK